MSIDLQREHLLTFSQARSHPAMRNRSGTRPHVSKIHRMHLYGVKHGEHRVRLEAVRLPSGYVTSTEAIERFVARLNDEPLEQQHHAPVTHALADAEAELDAAGI